MWDGSGRNVSLGEFNTWISPLTQRSLAEGTGRGSDNWRSCD